MTNNFHIGQNLAGQELNNHNSALNHCEANPSNRNKVIILGSGPNRIGQGIEFDYTCVHASYGFNIMFFEGIR
ncbi:MAG: hypothetical protein ACKO6C_04505, partial [Alphaproteobacteria bacterium]